MRVRVCFYCPAPDSNARFGPYNVEEGEEVTNNTTEPPPLPPHLRQITLNAVRMPKGAT